MDCTGHWQDTKPVTSSFLVGKFEGRRKVGVRVRLNQIGEAGTIRARHEADADSTSPSDELVHCGYQVVYDD